MGESCPPTATTDYAYSAARDAQEQAKQGDDKVERMIRLMLAKQLMTEHEAQYVRTGSMLKDGKQYTLKGDQQTPFMRFHPETGTYI
jgi:hypothetical protein